MLTQAIIDNRNERGRALRKHSKELLGKLLAKHVHRTRTHEALPIDGKVAVTAELRKREEQPL